jgi:Zn-dependent peptidase ImmA (M78 family)
MKAAMAMNVNQLSLLEAARAERPQADDDELVREICSELLAESGCEPPIDVELIASMCGIASIQYSPQPWAGVLIPDQDQVVARIRASDGHERQRFSVLHEAGHTLLPGFGRKREYRCNGQRTREEHLSDLSAAELLLPRAFFKSDLRQASAGFEGVEELAQRYEASRQATALRAVDLAAESKLLMTFKVMNKPTERDHEEEIEPKLRLAWSYGQGWPYARRYKSVPDASPFARAFAGELIDEFGDPGPLLGAAVGRVSVSARRYGDTVLALLGRS